MSYISPTDRHGLSVRNRRFTAENNGPVLQTLLEYIIAVSTCRKEIQ